MRALGIVHKGPIWGELVGFAAGRHPRLAFGALVDLPSRPAPLITLPQICGIIRPSGCFGASGALGPVRQQPNGSEPSPVRPAIVDAAPWSAPRW
jgi:hypothetical protein